MYGCSCCWKKLQGLNRKLTTTDTQSFRSRVNNLFLRSRNWNENGTERSSSRVSGALMEVFSNAKNRRRWRFMKIVVKRILVHFNKSRAEVPDQKGAPREYFIACALWSCEQKYFKQFLCKRVKFYTFYFIVFKSVPDF